MAKHEESVEVDVPVTTAYNQWTQFEEFPRFMEGVQEVRQLTDTSTHWKVEIVGIHREFDADITEQHPDERIAWRSTDGPTHAGVVTFHKLSDTRSKVMLQLDIDTDGFAEKTGEALGIVGRRIKGDLVRFKEFVESRHAETGAWRGDVPRS
jgi:uncharacterized membrane protein